jgi:hypothetical protein
VRNLLAAKVNCDGHVIEDSGSPFRTPQDTAVDPVNGNCGETFPAFKATVSFDGELGEILIHCFVCAFHWYVPRCLDFDLSERRASLPRLCPQSFSRSIHSRM